ncbi:MAG: hypothetical protein ABIH23_14330, partial [bacterium]
MKSHLFAAILVMALGCQTAGPVKDSVPDARVEMLRTFLYAPVNGWRFFQGDLDGAALPDMDDSAWEAVALEHSWPTPDTVAWYRGWVTIPENIAGFSVTGETVELKASVDDRSILFVNGERRGSKRRMYDDTAVLTSNALPGDRYFIAIKVYNNALSGGLRWVHLNLRSQRANTGKVDAYIRELTDIDKFAWTPAELRLLRQAREISLDLVDFEALQSQQGEIFYTSVDRATASLRSSVSEFSERFVEKLGGVEEKTNLLNEKIEAFAWNGIETPYPTATASALETGITYARKDIEQLSVRRIYAVKELLPELEEMAEKALAELNGPGLPIPPRYRTGPVTIENGLFYQNGHPVFFTGFGHFQEVRDDIPIFPNMGLSVIQIVTDAGRTLPAPDKVNMEFIEEIVETLDRAARH